MTEDVVRTVQGSRWTIVSRLLWPGIGRMVIEESRRLPAKLMVYRESKDRQVYPISPGQVDFLRRAGEGGRLTPMLQRATMLFNSDRGPDATVDVDLIVRASRRLTGRVLYHDQFAGLTGYLRKLRDGTPYALYVHETVLGGPGSVMDLTMHTPALHGALAAYDRRIIRAAKVVFTNSERNRAILGREGVAAVVAYPGCTPIESLPPRRDRFILAVALWERTKRPEVYAQLARRSGVPVVMAGMWGRSEEQALFTREFGDVVRVTGAVGESELDQLSRTASLYVRFGYGERGPGQGGIQALGYGMPVVTNPSLAISEIITDGLDGLIVSGHDEAAQKVKELFGAPEQLRAMSQAAWSRSLTLDWEAHTQRIREGLLRMQ